MNIQQVLTVIKNDFDTAITTACFNKTVYANGHKAKEALIRSQKLINYVHEFTKNELIAQKVSPKKIYPPLNCSSPEIKIKGFLKSKNQDIVIIPNTKLVPLAPLGSPSVEKIISINVRSQLSSLNKNTDTLYERTFAEALNLHLNYSKQCLGEIYLIPTHEYDDQAMKQNKIAFKSVSKIEKYIQLFQAINNRHDHNKDAYKYERICLLIVDFRKKKPKLYNSIKQLQKDGLISKNTNVSLENLTIKNFSKDLLAIYIKRFNRRNIT